MRTAMLILIYALLIGLSACSYSDREKQDPEIATDLPAIQQIPHDSGSAE